MLPKDFIILPNSTCEINKLPTNCQFTSNNDSTTIQISNFVQLGLQNFSINISDVMNPQSN